MWAYENGWSQNHAFEGTTTANDLLYKRRNLWCEWEMSQFWKVSSQCNFLGLFFAIFCIWYLTYSFCKKKHRTNQNSIISISQKYCWWESITGLCSMISTKMFCQPSRISNHGCLCRTIWSFADCLQHQCKRGHPGQPEHYKHARGVYKANRGPCLYQPFEWKKVVPLDQGNRPHTHSRPNILVHCRGWWEEGRRARKKGEWALKVHGGK